MSDTLPLSGTARPATPLADTGRITEPEALPTAIDDPRTPAREPGVPRPPALKALTSIRFFAALHVALYHFIRPFSRWGALAAFMENGYTGVSFFFVLSGFILTYAHAAEYERGLGRKARFWMARVARIYPVYALALLVAVAVGYGQLHDPKHWVALAADFLMLQSWSMRLVNFFHSGAWTLSCEAFFYLLFPFVLLPLRPLRRASGLLWLGLFFLLSVAAPLWMVWRYPAASLVEDTSLQPAGRQLAFLISRLPLFAVPQFLAGMSLGWLFLRFRPSARAASVMVSAGVALFTLVMLFSNHLPYLALHNGLLIPVYGLLLLGLGERNWLSRALSAKWLVLFGEASFAFYLFHILVIAFTERWGIQHTFLNMAWRLPLAIALSVGLYLYLEKPCRRRILDWYFARTEAGQGR